MSGKDNKSETISPHNLINDFVGRLKQDDSDNFEDKAKLIETDRRGFMKIVGLLSASTFFPFSELLSKNSKMESKFKAAAQSPDGDHELNLSGGEDTNPLNYYFEGMNIRPESGSETVLGDVGIGVLTGSTHTYVLSALDDIRLEQGITLTDGEGNELSKEEAINSMCSEISESNTPSGSASCNVEIPENAENVLDHGAQMGSNVDRSTAESNAKAIEEASKQSTGSNVYIPSGTLQFGGSFAPIIFDGSNGAPGASIYGDGPEKTFLETHPDHSEDEQPEIWYNGDVDHGDITWSNLTLDGNENLDSFNDNRGRQRGINFREGSSAGTVTFSNFRMQHMVYAAFSFGGGWPDWDGMVNQCTFYDIAIDLMVQRDEKMKNGEEDSPAVDHVFSGTSVMPSGHKLTVKNSHFEHVAGTVVDTGSTGELEFKNCYAKGIGDAFLKAGNKLGKLSLENVYHQGGSTELDNVNEDLIRKFDGRGFVQRRNQGPGDNVIQMSEVEITNLRGFVANAGEGEFNFKTHPDGGRIRVSDFGSKPNESGIGYGRNWESFRANGGSKFTFDIEEISIHGTEDPIFSLDRGSGRISTLQRENGSTLGNKANVEIINDEEGGTRYEPEVPSEGDVGILSNCETSDSSESSAQETQVQSSQNSDPQKSDADIVVTEEPYNAQGDGETDDTQAIQEAIDATSAGDMVYIPAGEYIVTTGSRAAVQCQTAASNVTIYGDGKDSVIKLGDVDDTMNQGAFGAEGDGPKIDNVLVRDLVFSGNKEVNSGSGKAKAVALYPGGTGHKLKFQNCIFEDSGGTGFSNRGISKVILKYCTSRNNVDHGFDFTANKDPSIQYDTESYDIKAVNNNGQNLDYHRGTHYTENVYTENSDTGNKTGASGGAPELVRIKNAHFVDEKGVAFRTVTSDEGQPEIYFDNVQVVDSDGRAFGFRDHWQVFMENDVLVHNCNTSGGENGWGVMITDKADLTVNGNLRIQQTNRVSGIQHGSNEEVTIDTYYHWQNDDGAVNTFNAGGLVIDNQIEEESEFLDVPESKEVGAFNPGFSKES